MLDEKLEIDEKLTTTQKLLDFFKAKLERQHHKLDKLKAQIVG